MSMIARIIAAIKTPVKDVETVAVKIADKVASKTAIAIHVDATDALTVLDSLSGRVRNVRADIDAALESARKFELAATAWTSATVKAATADVTGDVDAIIHDIDSARLCDVKI